MFALKVLGCLLASAAVLGASWKMAQIRGKGEKSAVKDITTSIALVATTIVGCWITVQLFFPHS